MIIRYKYKQYVKTRKYNFLYIQKNENKNKIYSLNTYNKNYILLIHQFFLYFYFNSVFFILNVCCLLFGWQACRHKRYKFSPPRKRETIGRTSVEVKSLQCSSCYRSQVIILLYINLKHFKNFTPCGGIILLKYKKNSSASNKKRKNNKKLLKGILKLKGIKKAHSEELTGWLKNMQILIWEEQKKYGVCTSTSIKVSYYDHCYEHLNYNPKTKMSFS